MSDEVQKGVGADASDHREDDDHQAHHRPRRHAVVRIKMGIENERGVEVEVEKSVTALLEVIAVERGCRAEELVLIREGADEPLMAEILIDAEFPHHRRHHVHHVSDVKLTVYYQAEMRERSFKRWATVEDVLFWAVQVFGIDPSMATEFGLVRHGQKEELPGTEHIGHLVGHCHELGLDLVRGDIANGCVR